MTRMAFFTHFPCTKNSSISTVIWSVSFFICSHGTDYYWAWIPPFGGLVGAVLGTLMYQLLAGNHLPEEDWKSSSVNTCELTSSEQSSQKLKNSNQTLDTLDGVKIVTTTLNSS